ncbi:MAG TPA: methyltransferase domain-containing protein [Kineosporiaceae bacterium]|nr:methyltransferase domain-containing protein [Kineosporiaceae bacterium]
MTSTASRAQTDGYVLGRTTDEYERVRAQARVWNRATGRLLDEIGLVTGACCLDAGCGPGETMKLMADRVGPAGRVLGIDVDGVVADTTLTALRGEGYRQCEVRIHDLIDPGPVPGGPFDLVYARLLLFHLPQRVAVLRRLWDAVAPGGHLLVQDYDLRSIAALPDLVSVDEGSRVVVAAMTAAGCDVSAGTRLPVLFAEAGIGDPDGTDVAGRIEPLETGRRILERTFRSILPAALAQGITTEAEARRTLAALDQDASRMPGRPLLWPLLIGAWRRKVPAA